jgi:hypothetical protein
MSVSELIVGITSTVIALVALAIAIWQGYVMRKHNKLSVRPLLRLDRVSIGKTQSISLINSGIGPAIINKFDVLVDDIVLQGQGMTRMNEALRTLGIIDIRYSSYELFSEEAFAVGETQALIQIIHPDITADQIKRIVAVLPRLKFSFKYVSIYGDEYSLLG